MEEKFRIHPNGGGLIGENALVDDSVYVGPLAMVKDYAVVRELARIEDEAVISGTALVYNSARIYGKAQVSGSARINGNSSVSGDAKVYGHARLFDFSRVFDNAKIYGNAVLRHRCQVYDNAEVYDNGKLIGDARIYNFCCVTKQPIVLTGISDLIASNITITDHHISMGCIALPPMIWEKYGMDIINSKVTMTQDKVKKWLGIILSAAEFHGCTNRTEDLLRVANKKTVERIIAGETQDRNLSREDW